ncbi:MAG TPA: IS4 family transposase [Polyangiaceae bacterium]
MPSPEPTAEAAAVRDQIRRTFTPAAVDELRALTGYNPRQRQGTAFRLMLTVVEGFLAGQTLTFTSLRAIFVRRFGFIRPCPFQKRFKQESAAAFFREALKHLVDSVVQSAGLMLDGPLGRFADVRIYDGTGQRVPPRGRAALPACTNGKAGTKWVMGYSIKTGLLEHGLGDAETAAEIPLWRKLVPTFTSGVLYLFDLGFFERALFASARAAGAHVLMRLKSTAKVRVLSHASVNERAPLPGWSLDYYLRFVSKKRGTVFDLDVSWGRGKEMITLRLVGFAHKANSIRWYLTTVPRSMLTANQVIQGYRLRWLIELLFRELKQTADLGRSFTADANAVAALTYGAMLAHALVRSVRIQAALANEVPLEELRPLACLHMVRAHARDLVDALAASGHAAWQKVVSALGAALVPFARERHPSRSRQRIALKFGAIGA